MKKHLFLALSLAFMNLCFGANLAELERACKARNSNACVSLADKHYDAKDYTKAKNYITKACDLDNANGCAKLAVLYDYNYSGLKQDVLLAKRYYGKACLLSKHQYPCDEYRRIAEFKPEIDEVDRQICASNDFSGALSALACFNIGYIYDKKEKNPNIAKDYYKQACDLKNKRRNKNACANLGFLYINERNFSKAKIYFEHACGLVESISCSVLGIMYEKGDGVKKDIEKAKFYSQKACEHGDTNTCEKLKEFK